MLTYLDLSKKTGVALIYFLFFYGFNGGGDGSKIVSRGSRYDIFSSLIYYVMRGNPHHIGYQANRRLVDHWANPHLWGQDCKDQIVSCFTPLLLYVPRVPPLRYDLELS